MNTISELRSEAFIRYERVVSDLQSLVKKLEEERFCLLHKNMCLEK